MTFWSAPHSVLPITFKILRVFKLFFLTYLRWGTKDNFLSNITPRNLVSSTTGIELLSRISCESKWRLLLADMHTDIMSLRIECHCQLPIALWWTDVKADEELWKMLSASALAMSFGRHAYRHHVICQCISNVFWQTCIQTSCYLPVH